MEAEEGIRRVVWLPRELDRQIEEIRQKIGYSRSGIYRYILTRFLEKTIITKRKKVHLRPWEEIVGTLKAIETDSQTISAVVACTQSLDLVITYPKETTEATILQNLNTLLGQKIAILKTDSQEKPLIVKTLNEKTTVDIQATIPIEIGKEKPRNFTKINHNKEDPKNEHKKQAPTTNLDRFWLGLIFGSLLTF
jgi:predicted transcriptional regulator